ncbi:MAG: DUF4878 domain-containing protein [Chitinophagaceae bacterium]|nr:DUF4878 domain-containing protein [Chitinophagaceae bacterium]MBL0304483.1 DUF4878 domain-containing protein [Chitinophagaceae bacterium]HQV60462.1 DUF4878 domain-containing protein [Chitinophagaceae bacterium]HQV86927.1 DUF4878 domain-containing protein [Chitinophagaceae bacterium]HQX71420.1 DUF4878 domain-containing protein [Chitinophagaceae bacterium]
MKKVMNSIFAVAVTALIITGCKGKDGVADNPKAVLVAFFERMAKKDLEGAAKLATKDSKSTMDMMKKAMDMAEKMKGTEKTEEDPAEDFKNMVVGDAKIDGSNATVSVTNKKKNETVDFPLKKEDGSWKVDFSMGTLMKMGMDKAKEDGTEINPEDIDKMKDFNMDSLKKGFETIDSALKSMDPKQMDQMKDAMKELEKMKQN